MGLPITVVSSGGIAVTQTSEGFACEAISIGGVAVTLVSSGGLPVNIISELGPAIVLSASQDTDGDAQGTAIGIFSVNGGTGVYTFTLTDDGGGTTQLSGAGLQVGATAPSVGTVTISVHADNGAGSMIDQPFAITTIPQTFAPSLNFSDARNSQYLVMRMI